MAQVTVNMDTIDLSNAQTTLVKGKHVDNLQGLLKATRKPNQDPGAIDGLGGQKTKAAVLAFVEALHSEYVGAGVRANAVLPSVIDTPANRESMPDADWSKWVAPAEIARVIRFLVSGDSAVCSGAAVPVYGRA